MIKNSKPNIVFRADGNSEIGLGHIIRSSALASAIRKDFNCILATRCKIKQVLKETASVFSNVIELPERDFDAEAKSFSEFSASDDLVILDGYAFDSEYQQQLMRLGYDFFSIDDIHTSHFFSKVIINHSGGLTNSDYKAEAGTIFYLGPYYSLLRRPFLLAAQNRRRNLDNKNCFVCFGGADPGDKTSQVLEDQLIQNYFDHFHVVTGSAYRHQKKLIEVSSARKNISLHSSLPAEKLVTVMQQCSYAICSPSTVVYEYMSVGGVVFLEQIADNQKDVIKYMTEEGFAFSLKEFGYLNEHKFQSSLQKQAKYFDGQSGERFKKIFKQYFESKKMILRRAEESDLQLCFEWANDVAVREQSYNQEPISLGEHINWFHQKIKDPNCFFYIVEMDQTPVAQIRFQVNDHEAVLSYLIDKSIRNRGLGTFVLVKGIEKFITDHKKPVTVTGYVKNSNAASQKSFEKLAFSQTVREDKPGSVKYLMHCGH